MLFQNIKLWKYYIIYSIITYGLDKSIMSVTKIDGKIAHKKTPSFYFKIIKRGYRVVKTIKFDKLFLFKIPIRITIKGLLI